MPAIQLTIKGKVQGVFYRQSAKNKAEHLHIKGWVKNNPDGSVSCYACGDEKELSLFTEWCKHGPITAKVTEVIVEKQAEEHCDNFVILRH